MCGIEGTEEPSCTSTSPFGRRGAISRSAETNCEDEEASIRTTGASSTGEEARPAVCRIKGSASGASTQSTCTPSCRRPSSTGPIGRWRACGSPSKANSPGNRAARAGTKRITVPARPHSMLTLRASRTPDGSPGSEKSNGVTCRSGPKGESVGTSSTPAPRRRNASIMRAESRECRGARRYEGESARAARSKYRFVSDFEPGICTVA